MTQPQTTKYAIFHEDKIVGKEYPTEQQAFIEALEKKIVVQNRDHIWLPEGYEIRSYK